jgi:hypothetical protein
MSTGAIGWCGGGVDETKEGASLHSSMIDIVSVSRMIREITNDYRLPTHIDVGRCEWRIVQEWMTDTDAASVRIWGLPIRLVPLDHCWIVRHG